MKNKVLKSVFFITTLFIGVITGFFIRHNSECWSAIKSFYIENIPESKKNNWDDAFSVANVESSKDGAIQKVYYYKSKSKSSKPLIVSLHTWSGDYAQNDKLAELCRDKDLNYIHPDFRGANNSTEACSSELVLSDIDDAISYALDNFNVNNDEVYVMGFSGGGYATLSTFMRSKQNIRKFSAWASISDLTAWYRENKILENTKYIDDILKCTKSGEELNTKVARLKSPINWNTPIKKLENQELKIYAGIYDGLQGSVPITHSINFYNKVLGDLNVLDSIHYVSNDEKLFLLEKRKPLKSFGKIADRKVFLRKNYKNLSLEIFDGKHEILSEYALNDLISSD